MPRPSRRSFMKKTVAAGAAASMFPTFLPGISRANQAGSKLSYASIGCGGLQGMSDLNSFASHPNINITVLCDVDENALKAAAAKHPQARLYRDFREMIATEGDKIDAVSITIPDHMHAPVAMTAINAGKHVYCQKPLTHEVHEARQLRLAAAEKGVVTQMGNQIHSHIVYRQAVAMARDGVIGAIKEVHSWSNAPGNTWKQNIPRPSGSDPIPSNLQWDNWLGTAPKRPYKEGAYHTVAWRGFQDFGGGAIGDFGCHIMDTPFTALDLNAPTSITAEVAPQWFEIDGARGETWPTWEIFTYEFPANGNQLIAGNTLKLVWYDGGKQPPKELAQMPEGKSLPGGGSMYIGEEGVMIVPHVGAATLWPSEKFQNYQRPKAEGQSHYHQWIDACLGKGECGSNFDYAGPLSEAVLLGNVANRFPGKTLKWDAASLKVTNIDEANQYLRRTYRDGWDVKGL